MNSILAITNVLAVTGDLSIWARIAFGVGFAVFSIFYFVGAPALLELWGRLPTNRYQEWSDRRKKRMIMFMRCGLILADIFMILFVIGVI